MIPLSGTTPAALRRLERQWAEAGAAAICAERAYQILVSGDEDGDAATSAAWLALWRAEERQRELGFELDRMQESFSTAA
jgi:hypothetical protein